MKKICIVTTRHISYNPRVLKEADSFYANGFDVVVVTINNHSAQRKFDEQLMRSRKWKLSTVDFRREVREEKNRWLYLSVKQKLFSYLCRITPGLGNAERASGKGYDELAALARKEKADIYIAHHAEALGAAFSAAKAQKVKLGFDMEDFHTSMNGALSDDIVAYLEKKYLPHCAYLTASSRGIGEAYAEKYGIPAPLTILNTFPLQKRAISAHAPIRFYWYSQVIGAERGLEELIRAAGLVKGAFEIHLRGSFHSAAYREMLLRLAEEQQLSGKLFFHDPILAEELIQDAQAFDIGLALELHTSTNANLAVSNKLFSYLMAGLAVIATDTFGQKDIMERIPAAGRVCRMKDAGDLAAAMQFYIDHPEALLKARQAAGKAADEIFNWEKESEKLITHLRQYIS